MSEIHSQHPAGIDQLLRTKLAPPRLNGPLVSRRLLLARLDEGMAYKLTLISAPPGFGKTTLVSEWGAARSERIAWVSLDPGDNDPVRFWRYVITACRAFDATLGKSALAALRASHLFHIPIDVSGPIRKKAPTQVTSVEIGASGQVYVPRGSNLKVYAGKNVTMHDIQGGASIYAGGNVRVRDIHTLVHASAGGAMDLECETLAGDGAKFTAGRDLRFHVHDLTQARVMVSDLGGYWEGVIGDGGREIRLTAGGDVTWVTSQGVKAQPPGYVLGNVERPNDKASDEDDELKGWSAGETSPQLQCS